MGGCKSKDLWPTVKPFLTNKGTQVHRVTILFEDNKLINDQQEVCGIFNHFFVNVAKNISQTAIPVNENHPSILKIKDNLTEPSSFEFKPIKEEFISKEINKLNLKKAKGRDGISTKNLKLALLVSSNLCWCVIPYYHLHNYTAYSFNEMKNLKRLIDELVQDSTRLIQWFADNQMKANPGKFQAIAEGKHTHSENICFNLGDTLVKCEDIVKVSKGAKIRNRYNQIPHLTHRIPMGIKLLGVIVDFELDFNEHISNVCKKGFTSA